MAHNAKDGGTKLLKECSAINRQKVVNIIITDLGIFDIDKDEMVLVRKADDVTIEALKSKTEAAFIVGL
ncbi:succinyl-CoA:3-ketoacid-CoA transferase [Candidatus Rickettsia kedanie]|uniref:Uncharacterized protein n=1 Tax=Candidatus Rickettsia kedanie TaxID=3115352 RepID=A0ABP9TZ15_9RICK